MERMMSYRACIQCCPIAEGMEAKVLVHKHITETQELAGLVTMLAQNFRITKQLTFLLLEDSGGEEEDSSLSGMEIKRESAINEFLACEMKTIKTEDVEENVSNDCASQITNFLDEDDENEMSQSTFEENEVKGPGKYDCLCG